MEAWRPEDPGRPTEVRVSDYMPHDERQTIEPGRSPVAISPGSAALVVLCIAAAVVVACFAIPGGARKDDDAQPAARVAAADARDAEFVRALYAAPAGQR